MYVKFNSSGRVEATQQTETTGFQEVDDSLLPYAILEDGVVRAQTEAEIAADEAAYVSAGNAISNRNKRNRLLSETDWVITKALEAGSSAPSDWATYRTALRDLPDHANWPDLEDGDWPTAPTS